MPTLRISTWTGEVFASAPGRISKKTVTVGAQVQPGSLMMAIVPDKAVWVVANFKETQLADVKVGQPVDVEVDAIPGVSFKGHIDSLSAGTGATFALLPPDNATGNFTKVVQRVPVKILFEPGQPRLPDLRVGMSVLASVHTRGQGR
ncbi:MAG: HlyD family secretion protein [Caulobacteraceae bacterium]|nr:MAG: HlyD family secretion protein [Caulobacteraceae bacterium]